MGRPIQIMRGSFKRGLNSKVVAFSTRLAALHSPMYKSNGKIASKQKQPPILYPAFSLARRALLLYFSKAKKPLTNKTSKDKLKLAVVYSGSSLTNFLCLIPYL